MNRNARIAALLLLTPSLAVAGFAGTKIPESRSVATRVAELLDYEATPCTTNCELGGCPDGKHNNESVIGGNDGGKQHSWCELGGCSGSGEHDHSCDRMAELVSPEVLNEMLELIPQIRTQQLVVMDREDPNLFVNRKRRAVQILGCQGLVLASVDLTTTQAAALDSLD